MGPNMDVQMSSILLNQDACVFEYAFGSCGRRPSKSGFALYPPSTSTRCSMVDRGPSVVVISLSCPCRKISKSNLGMV